MDFSFIQWNVDPEIANVLGISIRYYGLLFAAGIILCLRLLKWIFRRENIEAANLDKLTLYGMIGIFAGARLGHCLLYDPSYYLSHPLEMLFPVQQDESGQYVFVGYQGLASHGGAAGLLLALLVYARRTGEPVLKTLDWIGVVAPLGGCFIRLGNMMNSEILGNPTDVPWAFVFVREDSLPRHPAQLYEALSYLLILGVSLFLYTHYRDRLKTGFFFGLCLSTVFIARFLIEFLKERQVAFEENLPLDMGQLLSIPFVIVGLAFVAYGLPHFGTDSGGR